MRRVASAASVEPQTAIPALPPNVPVASVRAGTLKPERPNCRCSMCSFSLGWRQHEFVTPGWRFNPDPMPGLRRRLWPSAGATGKRYEKGPSGQKRGGGLAMPHIEGLGVACDVRLPRPIAAMEADRDP